MKDNRTILKKIALEFAKQAQQQIGYPVEVIIKPKRLLDLVEPEDWIRQVCVLLDQNEEHIRHTTGLLYRRRNTGVVVCTQICCYTLYMFKNLVHHEIGTLLNLDYSTVMYHVKKTAELIQICDPLMMDAWLLVYDAIKKMNNHQNTTL